MQMMEKEKENKIHKIVEAAEVVSPFEQFSGHSKKQQEGQSLFLGYSH